ncbi:unnamed protein product [Cuscuta europaea]|uniref:MADS-box domain-containing protein n=1 Tax=Cuscuta europaea TaxID=41803 RepID=A0A9P0YV07_CUSEU|nr:unnamed protein product [Cuscuta europaea]
MIIQIENQKTERKSERKMGKGKSKIEMKLIESRAARNVCFSKRRTGLFKKASDLCRLFPGVKVAAVVFSPAGNPYVYGDPTGIFDSQQHEQGDGSPLCALFPSPLSGDPGENTAWNSGGPLADEVIEEVIRGVQQRQLQGGCPPQYPSPSSVLAGGGGHVICEPCCYSRIEKETLNTPWEDDWLISGEDIGSMIQELQPQQGGGPVFPECSSPPSSVLASSSSQQGTLREEDVSSWIQELLC